MSNPNKDTDSNEDMDVKVEVEESTSYRVEPSDTTDKPDECS